MNAPNSACIEVPSACLDPLAYQSSGVPDGFQTVLGWLAENNPEALDLMYDPVVDTIEDEKCLSETSFDKDGPEIFVRASDVAAQRGIEIVPAFPLDLLIKRLG